MVAVQVRDVSEDVRQTLAAEAERRGQSLQVYLLDVLEREAADSHNRKFLHDYRGPLADGRRISVNVNAAIRADRLRDGA